MDKNIVLVHGAWADASSWSSVIPHLLQAGYKVAGVQLPLTSLEDDIAATRRVLSQMEGPVTLVGHSYGGSVITGAATDSPNVVSLVYIAAFAPAEGETLLTINGRFSPLESGAHIKPDKCGYLWIDTEAFPRIFAGDVEQIQAEIMAIVQKAPNAAIFSAVSGKPGWVNLPSWYLVCDEDLMIQPEAERWMAKRINATTRSLPASHAPMVSHPHEVASLILEAA